MKTFFCALSLIIISIPQSVFGVQLLTSSSIVAGVNSARIAHNLPAFVQNEALMLAAQQKVDDIAKRGVMLHTKVSADGMWWPLESVGYRYESAGENLAEGIENTDELVSGWMSSPQHRVNILNSTYTDIGVALAKGIYNGETVTFVVEYTAKPKKLVQRTVSTATVNEAEIIRQLIALLTEYASLLGSHS